MSVMPAWAIWVGGLAVLVVGALSGWLLLNRFGSGTAQDRVQLEILRLTGSIALGSGGAVALLLAARRQRATEMDIAQKKEATEDARHDATERRVTELYTKAAEQLGSDKAAVRLAGLYALERLAQDNPNHRPTIVEVICAYLRMPYTPPSTVSSSEVRSDDQSRRRRGLRPPNRRNTTPSPMRTITTLTSTLSGVVGPGQDQHQELQVRLAAQRVLTAHLRPELDEQGQPTNPQFWSDVALDLTGATLIDWNMRWCQVERATFVNSTFQGQAVFAGATFQDEALFAGATFQEVYFDGSKFLQDAIFDGAVVHAEAWFDAEFQEDAWFGNVKFHGPSQFQFATFYGIAHFRGSIFQGESRFYEAVFKSSARFSGATFEGGASFVEVTFKESAEFDGAIFRSFVSFDETMFRRVSRFEDATFWSRASFSEVTFQEVVWFDDAAFYSRPSFVNVMFHDGFSFKRATFRGVVSLRVSA